MKECTMDFKEFFRMEQGRYNKHPKPDPPLLSPVHIQYFVSVSIGIFMGIGYESKLTSTASQLGFFPTLISARLRTHFWNCPPIPKLRLNNTSRPNVQSPDSAAARISEHAWCTQFDQSTFARHWSNACTASCTSVVLRWPCVRTVLLHRITPPSSRKPPASVASHVRHAIASVVNVHPPRFRADIMYFTAGSLVHLK